MKKGIALLLFLAVALTSCVAFASLNDTRASITAQYGDYRLVVDTNNQIWTKAEWEASGSKKAVANSYIYLFHRQDLGFQMQIQYDSDKPDSFIRSQRITPDFGIKIKELKKYLPEVSSLAVSPKTTLFSTTDKLTRNFSDRESPVSLGGVLKEPLKRGSSTYFTLLAFSIEDEGRLISDAKYISSDTYIKELVIERKLSVDCADKRWVWIKDNLFL